MKKLLLILLFLISLAARPQMQAFSVSNKFPVPSWTDLTFPTVVLISESPATVWNDALAGFGWAHSGLSNVNLPANANGALRFKYEAADGDVCMLGFNATNSNQDYTNWEAGAYLSDGGLVYKVEGGTVTSTGVTISTGNYLKVQRGYSAFYIYISFDGLSWGTPISTLTYTGTAIMYVNININGGKLYYPMQVNLIP